MNNVKEYLKEKEKIIETEKERGDAAGIAAEREMEKLRQVKSMLDGMVFNDDLGVDIATNLEGQYRRAGSEFLSETKAIEDSAKEALEINKNELEGERAKIERARDTARDIRGTSDLAADAASTAERQLDDRADEYRQKEILTDNIVNEQTARQQNNRRKFENIFG
ncbi:MAG: hypothetical protein LBH62_05245 [Nitrososphaerota archaeon]|nr:hypothetical protein [Nitrososphaerota archaeon]